MKALKWLLGVVLVLLAVSVLIRTFAHTHQGPDQDEDEQEAVQSPSRVSVVNGQTIITLDAATQKRLGIGVTRVRVVATQRDIVATGLVLPIQDLISLDEAYIAARAEVQKAQASLGVSKNEYERLAELYKQSENASRKSLEAADGLFKTDEATLNAARQQLQGAESTARASWGPQVAAWMAGDRPEFRQLLNQRELPVQVTLPPGTSFVDPPSIELSAPDGRITNATYVSPFPRVDPRIQGISLLYLTPARPGMAPGDTLAIHFPTGRRQKGVLVPYSSLVWWQGQAWVYEQTSATHFTRRLVPTDEPLGGGYFVIHAFPPGTRVVVRGAQDLLSEEFRSQIQPED
ncbi:MAG: hypothetical protein ACRD3D_07750 [Terriglobia bacterium]